MTRVSGALSSAEAWAVRQSTYRFHLSRAHPFDAAWVRHARPESLQVSIHEGLETGVLLTGGHELRCEDHVVRGKPGDVWLVAMWEPHQWRVLRSGTQQVSIIFLPEFLGGDAVRAGPWLRLFTCPPGERPMRVPPETRKTTLAIGRELAGEIRKKGPGWETAMRLGVERLLFTLSRNWASPSRSDRVPIPAPPRLARITPALAAIHARPAKRVSLAAAAASCRLSPAQFSRVFRETMGLSYAKMRLRSHLAYAARLLLTTDAPVEAIATQAGFVDGSHLHRHFVGYYNTTPGVFRAQRR